MLMSILVLFTKVIIERSVDKNLDAKVFMKI